MKKRKKAAAIAVTAAAVAGVTTAVVFDHPADLVPEVMEELQLEDDDSTPEERQKGPKGKIRSWVMGLPAGVRMTVAVPLWVLGWILMSAAAVFWTGASPVLGSFLNWVCLAVLLLAVFAASVKAAFPDVSFRRILRVRNVVFLVAMSGVLWAADLVLPAVWEGYDLVSRTVWRVGAACLMAFACGAELKHQGKRARKKQAALPRRTAVEEEARRLADTVCGPIV